MSGSVTLAMLFGGPQIKKHPPGRIVRFDEPDVDIKLVTGNLEDRIEAALRQSGYPLTAKDVTEIIRSKQSIVTRRLREMLRRKIIHEIKIDGCVTEYAFGLDRTK